MKNIERITNLSSYSFRYVKTVLQDGYEFEGHHKFQFTDDRNGYIRYLEDNALPYGEIGSSLIEFDETIAEHCKFAKFSSAHFTCHQFIDANWNVYNLAMPNTLCVAYQSTLIKSMHFVIFCSNDIRNSDAFYVFRGKRYANFRMGMALKIVDFSKEVNLVDYLKEINYARYNETRIPFSKHRNKFIRLIKEGFSPFYAFAEILENRNDLSNDIVRKMIEAKNSEIQYNELKNLING